MKRRLLALAASILFALILLEGYGYLQAPRSGVAATGETVRSIHAPTPEQLRNWTRRRDRLRRQPTQPGPSTFSARYGWWNAPNTVGSQGSHLIEINAIGARTARALTEAPPPGARRVVCYGESFTFGTEVGAHEAWPARLEHHGGGDLEVWNLAVGGWGTDQALLRFRDTREALAPDLILVGLLSENIGRNVNRLRPAYWRSGGGQPMTKPRFLLKDGALELLPQPYASELELFEAAVDGSLSFDLAPHEGWGPADSPSRFLNWWRDLRANKERAPWRRLWDDRDGEARCVTLALIQAFAAEAARSEARFGVVLYPTQADVEDGWRMTAAREALEALGIPCFDAYDVIRARHEAGEPTYGETHFTVEANDDVAERVLVWLRREF